MFFILINQTQLPLTIFCIPKHNPQLTLVLQRRVCLKSFLMILILKLQLQLFHSLLLFAHTTVHISKCLNPLSTFICQITNLLIPYLTQTSTPPPNPTALPPRIQTKPISPSQRSSSQRPMLIFSLLSPPLRGLRGSLYILFLLHIRYYSYNSSIPTT
jgi:hypothetical protein